MLVEFKLPELGENITSGTVVKISVSAGDSIKKDQAILDLETEKATIEVPSPESGVIKEILVKDGDEIKVGQTIVKIETETATEPQAQEAAKEEVKQESDDKGKEPTTKSQPQEATKEEVKQETGDKGKEPIPAPPAKSGQQPDAPAQATNDENQAASSEAHAPDKDVPAAPSVRRFAREIGINVAEVPGSGAAGRISIEDVKAYAKKLNTGAIARSSSGVSEKPLPDFNKWGDVERKAMSKIRQTTSKHLSHAWQTIPHVTQFDKADITDIEKLRKEKSTPERKLTITAFILKVVASALKTYPQFNASVDASSDEIVYKKYYNIGVAVDTERGLLVPVLRDVDKKSIFELADELNALAAKARAGKLTLEEMSGGTFTITNLGGIGGTSFTPIINWPEVAILGISRAKMEPLYADNCCHPRLLLPLSLSYDHRLIDGADGARFLRWITDAIQQPFLLELAG